MLFVHLTRYETRQTWPAPSRATPTSHPDLAAKQGQCLAFARFFQHYAVGLIPTSRNPLTCWPDPVALTVEHRQAGPAPRMTLCNLGRPASLATLAAEPDPQPGHGGILQHLGLGLQREQAPTGPASARMGRQND